MSPDELPTVGIDTTGRSVARPARGLAASEARTEGGIDSATLTPDEVPAQSTLAEEPDVQSVVVDEGLLAEAASWDRRPTPADEPPARSSGEHTPPLAAPLEPDPTPPNPPSRRLGRPEDLEARPDPTPPTPAPPEDAHDDQSDEDAEGWRGATTGRRAALGRLGRLMSEEDPPLADQVSPPRDETPSGEAQDDDGVLPDDGPTLLGGPLVIPTRRTPMNKPKPPPSPEDFDAFAKAIGATVVPAAPSYAHRRVPARVQKRLERLKLEGAGVSAAPSASSAPTPALAQAPTPAPPPAPAKVPPRSSPARPAPAPAKPPPPVSEVSDSDLLPLDDDPDERATGELPVTAEDLDGVQDEAELPPPPTQPSPPRPAEPRPRERSITHELPALGDPSVPIAPSYGATPAKMLAEEREVLFGRVKEHPLDPEGYRMLAEHFDTANDANRSSLMLEVARALEGDPHAAPRTPRLILNDADRAGLRHPALRGESGELLQLVGGALAVLHPARGRDAGTNEEFHLGSGKGAKVAADALLAGVRILGLRSPDVFLSEDAGPPFSLVFAGVPRLLVGRLAVKRELSEAELRFFAGRALYTQLPDLLALRNLRKDEVLRGLKVVEEVALGRGDGPEARVVRELVPGRAWEKVRPLLKKVLPRLDLVRLADGARHSINRAGLVVCGGVAPALAALRAKKSLPSETIELVRFAASERYLQLRSRVLAPRG